MPLNTTVELTPEAIRVMRSVRTLPERMGAEIARVLDYQNDLTVSRIQKRYMSQRGGNTLGVVTNRLRSSVRRTKARISGNRVASAIGSNVEYMAAHEFGYEGPQKIKAHTRRVNQAFGIPLTKTVQANVKAHTRQVKIKERAPIRKGIRDRLPEYGRELSAAIINAI